MFTHRGLTLYQKGGIRILLGVYNLNKGLHLFQSLFFSVRAIVKGFSLVYVTLLAFEFILSTCSNATGILFSVIVKQ